MWSTYLWSERQELESPHTLTTLKDDKVFLLNKALRTAGVIYDFALVRRDSGYLLMNSMAENRTPGSFLIQSRKTFENSSYLASSSKIPVSGSLIWVFNGEPITHSNTLNDK